MTINAVHTFIKFGVEGHPLKKIHYKECCEYYK